MRRHAGMSNTRRSIVRSEHIAQNIVVAEDIFKKLSRE